jgi:hypothetical protein
MSDDLKKIPVVMVYGQRYTKNSCNKDGIVITPLSIFVEGEQEEECYTWSR